jgi:hypothetical protein
MGGGGGGGPTQTNVTQSNIPEWLRPQVESLVGMAGQEMFGMKKVVDPDTGEVTYSPGSTKPFTPYSVNPADYVAGFSPLQQQVQANVANLQVPGQFGQATDMAGAAGMGGMQSAQQALGYGNAGFQSGQLGQQLGIQGGQYYGGMGAGYGQQAAALAPQAQAYGGMGAGYGAQAANLAGTALGYGDLASQIGQMGLEAQQTGRGITAQSQDLARQQALAGQQYAQMATSPYAVQAYMSPYQQAVTDLQVQAAQRQADIASQARGSQAVRAGAFGGARQAIENAEANRALQSQLANIQAQGAQSAYDKAIQSMQYGSGLGLQGLGGAQSGLGTALQGGQLGLSGIGQALAGQQAALQGVGQAGAMYGLGMQGAQTGLQGLQAANQLYGTGIQGAGMGLQGVDRQLAGTGQGMQGAQVGLQGVSGAQAGYGLANQAAANLGQLGTQQLAAQTGILGLQNQIGAQQQAQEQAITNQAIQNYAQAQEAPMTALNQFNAILRGYAVPGTTTTQYQAAPSIASQAAGLGLAGIGLSNLTKKKGGKIDSSEGIDKIALRRALAGA